jgi:hypothetical protein
MLGICSVPRIVGGRISWGNRLLSNLRLVPKERARKPAYLFFQKLIFSLQNVVFGAKRSVLDRQGLVSGGSVCGHEGLRGEVSLAVLPLALGQWQFHVPIHAYPKLDHLGLRKQPLSGNHADQPIQRWFLLSPGSEFSLGWL